MHANSPRRRFLLDEGWKFHLGDVSSPLPNKHIAGYMANKAGWARGAARGSFDDSDWRTVNLPHDWSVEGAFDPSHHVSGGFLPRGIGWYRRYFLLSEGERGRRITIEFDGVATHCTVFVNGHLLHRNFCGYTPFSIDISDLANFGDEPNVVAVRVDATYLEGWWYEGAGIYRHTYITSTAATHFERDGVFVCPKRLSSDAWETHVTTTIANEGAGVHATLKSTVIDDRGEVIACEAVAFEMNASDSTSLVQSLKVTSPKLWSCDSPSLYTLISEIEMDGGMIDRVETVFGYREIHFDADKGFFLNGQHLKLKGTCNHQDHAGVGVALPDSLHEFRIRRLREMGCNAYRCAHNPPAKELLDACDRLGMLVMNENRNFGSSPEHLAQLRSLIRRDRNHPSVILWSICNEEAIQGTPVANRIAQTMVHEVVEHDSSRPVTAAVSGGILNDDCLADAVEIVGINYQLAVNDAYHAKHPHKPLIAAETHSVVSTRGVYATDRECGRLSSRDDEVASWGATARDTWKFVLQRPYLAGLFAWTGFDYRGEPTPFEWPCVSSSFGILDTCGFEKDAFFLHKAFFTQAPFVQISPHWNWSAGITIAVKVYANCEEVELFLNDRSLGVKAVDRFEMANWEVTWQPGILRAVGRSGGTDVGEHQVESTGPAARVGMEIHASANTSALRADGQHAIPLTVFAIDARGRRVPDAQNLINLEISGPARIVGVGNGNPACHESDKGNSRSLFNGLAQVIIQSTLESGNVIVIARSEGLAATEFRLDALDSAIPAGIAPASPRFFINDWRMSPITSVRPDPNQEIPEQDMNSWERIQPSPSGQTAWNGCSGFAIYRGKLSPPKRVQSRGGRIVFHGISGKTEVWIDAKLAALKTDETPASLTVALPAGSPTRVISLVIQNETTRPGGVLGRVEIVSD